jgi:predicted RNA-binding Zn-ribbon protein involved in translation (DUF1610 family)
MSKTEIGKLSCPKCGGNTIAGDVRSGIVSLGAFFHSSSSSREKSNIELKQENEIIKNGRVVSFACVECGLVSSYLDSILNKKT